MSELAWAGPVLTVGGACSNLCVLQERADVQQRADGRRPLPGGASRRNPDGSCSQGTVVAPPTGLTTAPCWPLALTCPSPPPSVCRSTCWRWAARSSGPCSTETWLRDSRRSTSQTWSRRRSSSYSSESRHRNPGRPSPGPGASPAPGPRASPGSGPGANCSPRAGPSPSPSLGRGANSGASPGP